MSSVKKLFVHYSHFTGSVAANLVIGLITFPILTRVLTKDQYGILGLVSTTLLLAGVFAKAGLSDGIIRLYRQFDQTEEQRTLFSSTVLIRGVVISGIASLVYILIFPYVSVMLKVQKEYVACFLIMAGSLFISPLNVIVINLMRVKEKAMMVNIINITGRILAVVLSLYLLLHVIHSFYGYFIGIVMADLLSCVILYYWFFSNYKISVSKVSKDLTLKLVNFGAPLLFMELSYNLLSYSDRYVIAAYKGPDVLAIYTVGYNLAMYIANMITFPLSYAIVPIYVGIYEKEGKMKTEEFLQRSLNYLLMAIIPLCVGYYVIAKDLMVLLASQKYAVAASFSPIIVVATLLLGINNILNAGLYLQKKTKTMLAIIISSVVINIVVNLLVVPSYGVMGAAYTMLLSTVTITILTVYLSFKYITISVNVRTILYYLMLSGILFFILPQITLSLTWVNLIAKCVIGTLIIFAGILIREKEIYLKVKTLLPF